MLENCKLSGFADEIHQDIEVQINLLKNLGQNYIEFRSANGKGVAEYTLEEALQLSRFLKEQGFKVSAIGSPIGKILITDDFNPHFEQFKHVVELSKILETKYIRMFSFYIPQNENPENYREEVFARMEQFVDYAKKQDVILLHENEKDIYGDNASRCLILMERFYGDHFKCTFDFANFVQCQQDTLEAFELLKLYIEYIHVKDARMKDGEVVPPGLGDGHLKEILQELHRSGFHGFLSLEPHLFNFDGLKNLEKNTTKRKLSSGEAAYHLAFDELKNILL
jgi:sugar phosphate isomerase/epimerase